MGAQDGIVGYRGGGGSLPKMASWATEGRGGSLPNDGIMGYMLIVKLQFPGDGFQGFF